MVGFLAQTVARDGNYLFRSLIRPILLENKGQCNKFRSKAVQQVYVVHEGQIFQPPTTIVEVESEIVIFVLYTLNRHH
jgi:hypothetical protein